jgi:hypothetical protein
MNAVLFMSYWRGIGFTHLIGLQINPFLLALALSVIAAAQLLFEGDVQAATYFDDHRGDNE